MNKPYNPDRGNIQTFPISDSPVNDAFEGIVELYYQLKGYITSTGKWFWEYGMGKQQRGYQDIDLLAINGDEAVIVSVSSCLDDKINFSRSDGKINRDKLEKLQSYFSRTERYLNSVNEYKWIGKKKIKKVIAVINKPTKKYREKLENSRKFKDENIEILYMNEMDDYTNNYLDANKNLKIQHQAFRTLQIKHNMALKNGN